MGYNFFKIDLSNHDFKKLLEFSLSLSSFFNTPHVDNPEILMKDFNIVNTQGVYYRNTLFDSNAIKIFNYYLNKADILIIDIPFLDQYQHIINSFKSLKDKDLNHYVTEILNYKKIRFQCLIDDTLKVILKNINFFEMLKLDPKKIDLATPDLSITFLEEKTNRELCSIADNIVVINMTKTEVENLLKDGPFELGYKSNVAIKNYAYCNLNKVTKDFIYTICNIEEDVNDLFFKVFSLYDNNKREILKFYFNTTHLCLTDIELEVLKNQYNLDCSKWIKLRHEETYLYPDDLFLIEY